MQYPLFYFKLKNRKYVITQIHTVWVVYHVSRRCPFHSCKCCSLSIYAVKVSAMFFFPYICMFLGPVLQLSQQRVCWPAMSLLCFCFSCKRKLNRLVNRSRKQDKLKQTQKPATILLCNILHHKENNIKTYPQPIQPKMYLQQQQAKTQNQGLLNNSSISPLL